MVNITAEFSVYVKHPHTHTQLGPNENDIVPNQTG